MLGNQFNFHGPGPQACDTTGILRLKERERVSAKSTLSSARLGRQLDFIQNRADGFQRVAFKTIVHIDERFGFRSR